MSLSYMTEESTTSRPHYSSFSVELPPIRQRVTYRVLLEKGQDGWIVAKCLDVKGAISQGKNREEALKNIIEAISAILEDIYEGKEIPEFMITWEER